LSRRILLVCLGVITVAAACDSDELSPEEALRQDLDELVAAFNDGDAEQIYDDFMALDCRNRVTREEAEERFEEQASNARLTIDEPLRIEIAEDKATVRTAISATSDADEESALDNFAMVLEEGHWRFVDCFGATDND
jgi:hypothetical protein